MTLKEHMTVIGKKAYYRISRKNLRLKVTILDVREVFGRVDYFVESDKGEDWVEATSLEFIDK